MTRFYCIKVKYFDNRRGNKDVHLRLANFYLWLADLFRPQFLTL